MKNFLITAVLALCTITGFSQTKVGTIDADYIASQLPGMVEVEEGLKTYNAELQADVEADISEYQKLVEEYQANDSTYTEAQRKEKQTAIINLENDIKGFRQKAAVMIQMKRNELTQPLYEKIDQAMNEVIQEEGYTHIFNTGGASLAFAAAAYDITDKVLKKLGVTPKPQPEE